MERLEPTCRNMSGWAMLSMSARRAEALFCSPESGRWCCSARESGRRPFSRCYALASAGSTRQVLWLHAARDRQHHPFAAEVRRLMMMLTHGRSYVCYSKPGSRDKMGEDFD